MTNKNKLKVILVTSQLTYVPENYLGLFEGLLEESSEHIAGVIFLKNLDFSLFKTILGLRYLGAKRIQGEVIKNISALPAMKREKLLENHDIDSRHFKSMNNKDAINWCKELKPDLIINARTRCIYKADILSVPKLACVNVHHGILPKYRGTMSDLYALYEGRRAGFTIHQMNKKIDDGLIYKAKETSQPNEKDYLKYIYESSIKEGQELSSFIKTIAETKSLPQGLENKSDDIIFTKNPTRSLVKKMLAERMIL